MQPLSQRIRQQKQIILTLYVVTLISFWGLILYTLQLEWRICLNEAKESLHHQASTTSELIHELLVDKTRILDSVRSALEKGNFRKSSGAIHCQSRHSDRSGSAPSWVHRKIWRVMRKCV